MKSLESLHCIPCTFNLSYLSMSCNDRSPSINFALLDGLIGINDLGSAYIEIYRCVLEKNR